MAFLHPETVSRNSRPEWDADSACGSVGKLHPTPIANSGSHFPPEPSTGNCIHSKGEFRDTLSETPSIRKARPTLNTSSERMRACRPGRSRHRGDGKCHPKRLPRLRPQVSRKKPQESRGFHVCTIERAAPRTAKLLSQHGLLGRRRHMVQIILGGVILCGNPVVEQQLSAGVVGILFEHGLVALFDRGAHLALAHCPAH